MATQPGGSGSGDGRAAAREVLPVTTGTRLQAASAVGAVGGGHLPEPFTPMPGARARSAGGDSLPRDHTHPGPGHAPPGHHGRRERRGVGRERASPAKVVARPLPPPEPPPGDVAPLDPLPVSGIAAPWQIRTWRSMVQRGIFPWRATDLLCLIEDRSSRRAVEAAEDAALVAERAADDAAEAVYHARRRAGLHAGRGWLQPRSAATPSARASRRERWLGGLRAPARNAALVAAQAAWQACQWQELALRFVAEAVAERTERSVHLRARRAAAEQRHLALGLLLQRQRELRQRAVRGASGATQAARIATRLPGALASGAADAAAHRVLALGLLLQRQRRRAAALARAAAVRATAVALHAGRAAAAALRAVRAVPVVAALFAVEAAVAAASVAQRVAGAALRVSSWDAMWEGGSVRTRMRLLYGCGHRIVEQWGWREGVGLGQQEQGLRRPLVAQERERRAGLRAFGERRRPLLSWRNRFVGCSVQRAAGAAARAALLARRLVVVLEGRLSGYDAGLVACEAARDARAAACRAAVEVLRCRVAGEGGAIRHKRRRAACSRLGGAAGARCGGGSRQGAARGGVRVLSARLWCCRQRTRLSGGGCDVPYRWAAPRPKQASSTAENLTKREKTT